MRLFKYFILFLCLLALIAAGLGVLFATRPLALQGVREGEPLDFVVSAGQGLRGVSQQLSEAGLGFEPWQFTLLVRLLGRDKEIKAGSYEVRSGPALTPLSLLDKLTRGDVSQGELLLVEGATFRQLRAALDASPDLRHETRGLSDAEVLAKIGATEPHPEGLFFPDTYLFTKKTSDLELLGRAYRHMQAELGRAWQERAPEVQLSTPYQALIMASIVEKETGQGQDRPQIAAVFLNRLRQGMRLQTDPTVIYGMGSAFDGNLRRRDLQADTPYNTYTRSGLPPTPISMPGRAALQAVLHPPRSDKLYFVARGDGSSQFSRTLEEHNRAVMRYQKGK